MNRKNENQLSEHIKQVMLEYEEPYVLGSWERFQRYKIRKNNIRKQRIFMVIAASVIIVLIFGFAIISFHSSTQEQVVEQQLTEQQEIPGNNDEPHLSITESENDSYSQSNKKKEHTGTYQSQSTKPLSESNPNTFAETHLPVSHKPVPESSMVNPASLLSSLKFQNLLVVSSSHRLEYLGSSEFNNGNIASNTFVGEKDIRQSFGNAMNKNVVFSFAYASVMNIHGSQTDLGAGGGFYTDWNFAKNLTLSSGLFIAQNRLKYENEQTARLAKSLVDDGTPTTLTTDDLDYVQLDFVNLEIPLNIRYSLTDELSVSAGVSSMAFLKEEYEYNFEYEQKIQVFQDDETAGPRLVNETVTVRTMQTQSEPSLNSMNWAGFYTFSVGYKQTIFQRYSASFEPFIKIPAGQVTSRGISYTTGGVQLKISF